MIKKSFSALLCGLMLIQGSYLPISANEEEVEVMEDTSSEFVKIEDFSEQENLEKDELPLDEAIPIKTNSTVTDCLEEYGTVKWYEFEVSYDGYVELDFKHPYIENTSNIKPSLWDIELYNTQMKSLVKISPYGDTVQMESPKVGVPSGKYYIKISKGTNYSDADFNFKVSYTSSNNWEKEENNTYQNATSIPLNTSMNGALAYYYDVDWYTFDLDSLGYVEIEFKHQYIETSSWDPSFWDIELYNEDFEKESSFSILGDETIYKDTKIGLDKGTYHIKVSKGGHHDDMDYTLKVNFKSTNSWEIEPNDSSKTATPVTLGITKNGVLENRDDSDWYSISLSDGEYTLVFTPSILDSSSDHWEIAVYDSELTSKIEHEFPKNGNSWNFKVFNKGTNKTYIQVKASSYNHLREDYSFYISKESNPEPTPPKPDPVPNLKSITKSDVSLLGSTSSYTLVNGMCEPEVVVKVDGKTLKKGTDYTVTYSNSNKVGTATATVKGIGDYEGTVRLTYTIQANTEPDPIPNPSAKTESMYRLYNPKSGEHFYTADSHEKDVLVSLGWNYEGVGWNAPITSTTPVYRLYNKNAGDHHYTTDRNEKDTLVRIGWNDEGTGWYSDDNKGKALYRVYNPNAKTAGSHHYTLDSSEKNRLVSIGWKDEGIAWYGMK